MKKLMSLLLCAAVVFSLSGCAGTELIANIKNFNLMTYLGDRTDWATVQVEEPAAGSPYKYYFNRLGNKEKQAYSNILAEIEAMPAAVEIPSLTQKELSAVFEALLYDNPYLFFIGRNCTITTTGTKSYFNAEYVMTAAEYSSRKQALEGKADKIAAGFSNKDRFDAELYIHDTIIDTCAYSNTGAEDESSAYGALVTGAAACEGYAKAAKLLLDLAGTDCFVLGGMAKNAHGGYESHMWNMVNIDGDFYHLDTTWDDPVSQGESKANDPVYAYFNITDTEIGTTHKDFSSLYPCTATAANYFVKKGLQFDDYSTEVKAAIAQGVAAAAEAGRTSIEIKFESTAAYTAAYTGLVDNTEIYDILDRARKLTAARISSKLFYRPNEDFNILELVFG